MTNLTERSALPRLPSLAESLTSLSAMAFGIGISIYFFGLSPHLPMLIGVGVAALVSLRLGYHWDDLQKAMIAGITNALGSIMILMLVGILIGVWILGGVVPSLVYYGLQVMSPGWFLPAACVICSIASLATGTSWGTTGTIGVALMGVGAGLGLPLPLVAGAVISGAYFGDKISPLSDTTNLAPAMVGVDLYTHIRHMLSTTAVAYGISLVLYTVLGLRAAGGEGSAERIAAISTLLQEMFVIHPLLLLPPLIVIGLSFRRIPAIPGIAAGAVAGIICCLFVQGQGYGETMNVAMSGFSVETGNADVDALLSRGGLESMSFTISLIIVAMMFGGIMTHTSQMKVVAERILGYAKSTGSLILTTALTAIATNMIVCDQYMSLVMTGRMYEGAYRERNLAPENLSRVTEDAGTVIDPLVPWGSGGAYQTATLGVSTWAYAPFAFFCWLSPIVTIIFGYTGFTIRQRQEPEETATIAPAE